MARTKKTLGQLRPSDLIAISSLLTAIPIPTIQECLAACGKETIRKRKLPFEFLVYYVIFLSVYGDHSTAEVLKYLLQAMPCVLPDIAPVSACEAAISQGRTRLGEQVLHHLFKVICRPLGDANHPTAATFYQGHRLVTIVDSDVELQDTEAIRLEYLSANDSKMNKPTCPNLRFQALLEVGTGAVIDAEIDNPNTKNRAAQSIASKDEFDATMSATLLQRLDPEMLFLGEQFYTPEEVVPTIVGQGANFLLPVSDTTELKPIWRYKDDSYLAQIKYFSAKQAKNDQLMVRVIEDSFAYKKNEATVSGKWITSLLVPKKYPVPELAKLWQQYQKQKIDSKTLADQLRPGKQKSLRSKTITLVRQEFWGAIIAHYVTRKMMREAGGK